MKNLLQLGGAVLVTVGAGLIALPLGLIVGGIFGILIGISLER
jgi:hypothetical protein